MGLCAHGALGRKQLRTVFGTEHIHIRPEKRFRAHDALSVALMEEYIHLPAGGKVIGYRVAVEVIAVGRSAGIHHIEQELL